MRYNVKPYSQFLPLVLCRHGGGISAWHLPQFSIFQNRISRLIGEVHCLMDQIFLSSTLSYLLAIRISNRCLSLWKEKMFKNKFCSVLYWNSAKPYWKICVRGKDRVVNEHTTSEVGKIFKPLFRELEEADVWHVYLVIQFHIAVVVHRNPLIVAGGSLCVELTAGSWLHGALDIMMFKTCEYKITMSSSSISWEGRKNQTEEKYAPLSFLLPILFNNTLWYGASS